MNVYSGLLCADLLTQLHQIKRSDFSVKIHICQDLIFRLNRSVAEQIIIQPLQIIIVHSAFCRRIELSGERLEKIAASVYDNRDSYSTEGGPHETSF